MFGEEQVVFALKVPATKFKSNDILNMDFDQFLGKDLFLSRFTGHGNVSDYLS